MCYTLRHDYGIDRLPDDHFKSGMTDEEREHLYNEMAQIYDNCFSPVIDSLLQKNQ